VFAQSPVRQDVSETSEFLVETSEQQRQMRQAAPIQRQTALWQQDGWVKAVAHIACVHYDSCTGQHKVVIKVVS